jgi:hypothetical protein
MLSEDFHKKAMAEISLFPLADIVTFIRDRVWMD